MEPHEIKKQLKKRLDKERYDHTLGVMYTAGCLAMAYSDADHVSMEQAMLAGLLHDCAKCYSPEEQLRLCKKNHIATTTAEKSNPGLLHAKLGAYFAEKKYGVTDANVLHAIQVHTTGAPGMNTLDKILYIADYIEPGRYKADNLPEVRRLAFVNLDETMLKILSDTLEYLEKRGGTIDPMTQLTYEYYKKMERKLHS
jgi:predicted HD superfamily hydrolase involved in NAD metabolism